MTAIFLIYDWVFKVKGSILRRANGNVSLTIIKFLKIHYVFRTLLVYNHFKITTFLMCLEKVPSLPTFSKTNISKAVDCWWLCVTGKILLKDNLLVSIRQRKNDFLLSKYHIWEYPHIMQNCLGDQEITTHLIYTVDGNVQILINMMECLKHFKLHLCVQYWCLTGSVKQ